MFLAGVDEVGRGPLVGNVVTAAVILDSKHPIEGLTDSKKLSETKRNQFYDEIIKKALSWCVALATPEEVDKLNIYHATHLAMKRAVEGLNIQPDFVKVDGNKLPDWHYNSEAIVKGDLTVPEISAASILAKVTRDRQMKELDKRYPEYGFAKHKGYPTKMHLEKLREYGPVEGYRRSFKPVAQLLSES